MSRHTAAIHIAVAVVALASAVSDASAIGTGTVAAGAATITTPNPTTTLITQTSSKAVINWTGPGAFNTAAGQTVQFAQPNDNAIALNLISGGPTSFNGNLLANGRVWLINPDGMLFGNGSTVNVSSLLLSTAGFSNPTGNGFFSNTGTTYTFDQPGNPTASITIDHSYMSAFDTTLLKPGDLMMQAPQITVTNSSTLSGSTTHLLAGETFTADFNGDGLINYEVINTPVSVKVPGSTSSVEVSNNTILGHAEVTVGALVDQDAVLDHVINLGGQYEVGTYNESTNPEHVVIVPNPTVYETIVPNPPPPVPAASVILPTSADAVNTRPLTRALTSLGDESVKDTSVNPAIANVSYERPYRVNLSTSIAEGDLTLLAPSAGGTAPSNPVNLGDLSPSAGGNMATNAANLGNLSPSAGGVAKGISCANAYLDTNWMNDPASQKCAN